MFGADEHVTLLIARIGAFLPEMGNEKWHMLIAGRDTPHAHRGGCGVPPPGSLLDEKCHMLIEG